MPPDLVEKSYLTLAHELGHMFLHQLGSLDHSPIGGNIMWENGISIGKDITSDQLKIILDHAKTKGPEIFFFVEK